MLLAVKSEKNDWCVSQCHLKQSFSEDYSHPNDHNLRTYKKLETNAHLKIGNCIFPLLNLVLKHPVLKSKFEFMD